MHVPLALWVGVSAVIVVLIFLDLLDERRNGSRELRRAATASAVWILAALMFGGAVWLWAGASWAGQYFAGYLTEKALSVDNLFVFAVILDALAVPKTARQRVLRWGVIGALVARGALILGGVSLLDHFWWASYFLGALVVITGARLLRRGHATAAGGESRPLRVLKKHLAMEAQPVSSRFFVRRRGSGRFLLHATPLLVALVVIEATDIAFALDSVPAVLSLTKEPFLVFTSNAFAVLGLRALYFVLEGVLDRLPYLNVGLAVILVLVGTKMLVAQLWAAPLWMALGAIGLTLAVTVAASLVRPADPTPRPIVAAGPASSQEADLVFLGTSPALETSGRSVSSDSGERAPGGEDLGKHCHFLHLPSTPPSPVLRRNLVD